MRPHQKRRFSVGPKRAACSHNVGAGPAVRRTGRRALLPWSLTYSLAVAPTQEAQHLRASVSLHVEPAGWEGKAALTSRCKFKCVLRTLLGSDCSAVFCTSPEGG